MRDKQIVSPICERCGKNEAGPQMDLLLKGWGLDIDGDDLCPSFPHCKPKETLATTDF